VTDAERIAGGLADLAEVAARTVTQAAELAPIVATMRATLAGGGTLFFAGNGGSAADAQHLATEYVVRYHPVAGRPRRAVALTTDASLLTAAANDFGFEHVFARQIEALGRPGDALIVHSTSGNSPNCLLAVEQARALGIRTIALTGGDGGALRSSADHCFVVPDHRVHHIQEIHLAIQHQIAALLTLEEAP
jgi:D-sedoheptulose 7-phosphate isomerase